ncbi:MAG: NAD-binding protein [Desulfobacterales bacterium]
MEFKKLYLSFLLLMGVIAFGTLGYHYFEDMTFFDAFYQTIITITTVGFSEIKPLSTQGRTITIFIIVTGIGTVTYSLGQLISILVEGELGKFFGRKKLAKKIADLKDHYIVCGFGRIGKIICDELHVDNIDFVVIEENLSVVEELERKEMLYILMNATSDEALIKAGIMKARGLVTAVSSDADNVFITLTAKGFRPDIFILSRSSDVKNESKLIRAGASQVVSPYLIGGRRMAQVLKRPTVVDFIDIATMGNNLGLMMEEAKVGRNSGLIGKTIIESNLRQNYGVIIVAIKKQNGEMVFNPMPSERLEQGDVIVVIGKNEEMLRMRNIL